jgi:hypothetical protein
MPRVIVLIGVLAGAELLGVSGVVLALPLSAAGRVDLDYILHNRDRLWTSNEDQAFAPDVELDEGGSDAAEDADDAVLRTNPDAS